MNYQYNLPQPRITTDTYGHKLVDGETWMGGIRVPMLPNRIALRDLTTGEYRVLSHTEVTEDNPTSVIDLVTINTSWSDVIKVSEWYYGTWTLMLSSGVLFFLSGTLNRSAGLILTRRAYDRTVLELTSSSTGEVVYTSYTL